VDPWPAVEAPPPLGCEAGADGCAAGAALGAGALPLFFCPQARLGTAIRLRINSHLATILVMGWLDFIVTLLIDVK